MCKLKLSAQEGRALVMALIMLGIGALLIPPFLAHVSTNLLATRVTEGGMKEQYAADSGIEYALWRLDNAVFAGQEDYEINDKNVNVTWGLYTGTVQIYKITSTATSDDGSSTTTESYVEVLSFFDSAITSPDLVTIQQGSTISGSVISGVLETEPDTVIISQTIDARETQNWPEAGELSAFYWEDVKDSPDPGSRINLKDTNSIGPLYRAGDLEIYNTGGPVTATLEGTVYIADNLTFKATAPKAFTIDLNGQTIYVGGEIKLESENYAAISGSGCIIARGKVDFFPVRIVESDPDDPDHVFIMSIENIVKIRSTEGTLYGAVAGKEDTTLRQGTSMALTDVPASGLNFPIDYYTQLYFLTHTINP